MGTGPPSLARGTTIGGWEIQRPVAERPWPEARAERADGTLARLMVVPAAAAPGAAALAAWRAAMAPAWLDHPAFPTLRGLGHDAAAGAVWLARAWTPWTTVAAILDGTTTLPAGRRGAALVALGEALALLHRGGGFHGALAPGRVLLARADGSACEVLDLGLVTLAAGLGLRVPGAPRPPEDTPGQAGDVHAFAGLVEGMLVRGAPGSWTWKGRLAGWCQRIATSAASARPGIDEALDGLRAILPAPEPAEPPPPPLPPPSARDLAIIERVERAREAELAARNAALDRQLRPAVPAVTDVNTPFVSPIVVGGPGLAHDAWPALVKTRRPAAVMRHDPGAGTLVTVPVTWHLGHGQRPAAAEAIADAIAHALDALHGRLGGRELEPELKGAGFAPVDAWPGPHSIMRPAEGRPRGTSWWYRQGTRVVIAAGVTRVQREHQGWVTSHELGTVAGTVVELAAGGAPRGGSARSGLLAAMLTVAGRVDERPTVTFVCRFCRGPFTGLHFHAHLGACHGCSEHHLHIVH